MAEIKIERKGSSTIPWIVGVVLLAVVLLVVFQFTKPDQASPPPAAVTTQ